MPKKANLRGGFGGYQPGVAFKPPLFFFGFGWPNNFWPFGFFFFLAFVLNAQIKVFLLGEGNFFYFPFGKGFFFFWYLGKSPFLNKPKNGKHKIYGLK